MGDGNEGESAWPRAQGGGDSTVQGTVYRASHSGKQEKMFSRSSFDITRSINCYVTIYYLLIFC